jgi:serine/threonine protein kinase
MLSSDVMSGPTFKILCTIINKQQKGRILESIIDAKLRDFIERAIEDDSCTRSSIEELLAHEFLKKSEEDHQSPEISKQLPELIK